ncbi:MAG: efflux RND transporter periplasmic adaptor subunit [Burkholderiaceae bacterium]|nr:efflux RND transporter periplasmic adaptor subunit [Burkholderiaceae bacterium]
MPDRKHDLTGLLGPNAVRRWYKRPFVWLTVVAVAAAVGAYVLWRSTQIEARAPRYVTVPIARGSLAITVSATGTLKPTRTVNIGSELSGTVENVLVDVNDQVRKGQLLLQLDTAKLRDAVAGSQADLAAAQAQQRQARAAVREAQTTLAKLEDVARLSQGRLPSRIELDSARAALDKAVEAEGVAVATVAQRRASLSTNETNLHKASIRSPIDGIVLARSIEPGSAVAASLQAVTLLTLAQDLAKMELSVNVDEADVFQVAKEQRAHFTVASQPGRKYPASVIRVAYGSTITDGVVTYTTLLSVDNRDLSLRPGMTGTATIAATERRDVLLVPNSALRFKPTASAAAAAGGGLVSKLMPRPPSDSASSPGAVKDRPGESATLWVLEQGQPKAISVQKGLSDGRQTEVTGQGIAEGLPVIVERTVASAP